MSPVYLEFIGLHLGYFVQCWVPQYRKRRWWTKAGSAKGHWDGWVLEHLPYEERLREMDLLSLEKRWLQEDPAPMRTLLRRQLVQGRKMTDSEHIETREVLMWCEKKVGRVINKQWDGLPREAVYCPFLGGFKPQWDKAQSKLGWSDSWLL